VSIRVRKKTKIAVFFRARVPINYVYLRPKNPTPPNQGKAKNSKTITYEIHKNIIIKQLNPKQNEKKIY
jgi:hypothetical protein